MLLTHSLTVPSHPLHRTNSEWKNRKQHTLGVPMSKLGLYYTQEHVAKTRCDVDAVVDLGRQGGEVVLRDNIKDTLGIYHADGSINFDRRCQIIKACMKGKAEVPEGWFNEDLAPGDRMKISGLSPDAQRRKRLSPYVAVSPTVAKIKKALQLARDTGEINWYDEVHPFVPGVSIKNPAADDRTSWKVSMADGLATYTLRTTKRKAVLCPLATGLPAKLLQWHQKYGFVAKSLPQYLNMEVPVLLHLLCRSGYQKKELTESARHGEPFDYTMSTIDDHSELAALVHKTYSTLRLCLWGDNADLSGHSHAAFLWHVVYYPWQWDNTDAAFEITKPNLHLLCRAGAGREHITRCIERVTEDFLVMQGVGMPVNRTMATLILKYCLGDEHFLSPAAGLTGSGNADTSYASITSAATRREFKEWSLSFFCWHWRPAEIVSQVRKSGWTTLDIDKLNRVQLCDLLQAMECDSVDVVVARGELRANTGGYNQDHLKKVAKRMLQGACAVPGWCSADPDALEDSPMLMGMRFVRDGMHSSAMNIAHCIAVIKLLEGSVVAKLIEEECRKLGCGEGTMMRCCDWRLEEDRRPP